MKASARFRSYSTGSANSISSFRCRTTHEGGPLCIGLLAGANGKTVMDTSNEALLQTIASLRSQLAQTQARLQQAQTAKHELEKQASIRHRRSNPSLASAVTTAEIKRQRRTSAPLNTSSNGLPGSPSSATNSTDAASLSLRQSTTKTPSSPLAIDTSAHSASVAALASNQSTPTSYALKRDKSYEDLNSVMNQATPSPISAHTAQHRRRKSSIPNGVGIGIGIGIPRTSLNGPSSPDIPASRNASNTTRIPMPVFPKGHVGTAATLAGGSPKVKENIQEEYEGLEADGRFDGPPPLFHSAQSNPRHSGIIGDKGREADDSVESIEDNMIATLPLPPSRIARPVSPALHGRSSDGDTSVVEAREGNKRHSSRGGSSPFFGGSGGAFNERHGQLDIYNPKDSMSFGKSYTLKLATLAWFTAARIASSQSGTTKVIMSLQTDLTNARTVLESTRSQLRASARAVDSLTRQVEDVKEAKERLRIEAQGVATTLARRERMLEETLARARAAESSAKSLEDEKKVHNAECARRIKDLENRLKEAEERKAKAESEYAALRSATSSLSEGWKREIKQLKKDQAALRLTAEKDSNEARSRQAAVTKLLSARTSTKDDITKSVGDVKAWQEALHKQYNAQIATLTKQTENSAKDLDTLRTRTQEVMDGYAKYTRAMRTHNPDETTTSP